MVANVIAMAAYRGGALLELERYQEALDSFEQAWHFGQNDSDTYYNKGIALEIVRE